MNRQVEQILDERVRPALTEHGGDVRVIDCKGGILQIELLGQCSNCPASHLTAEFLISREIKSVLPEIKSVLLVQSVSDDMLDMARKILHHQL